jgi:hypothetical protein
MVFNFVDLEHSLNNNVFKNVDIPLTNYNGILNKNDLNSELSKLCSKKILT